MKSKIIKIDRNHRIKVIYKSNGIFIYHQKWWLIFWEDAIIAGARNVIIKIESHCSTKDEYLFNPSKLIVNGGVDGYFDMEIWNTGSIDVDKRINEICANFISVLQKKEQQKNFYHSLAK